MTLTAQGLRYLAVVSLGLVIDLGLALVLTGMGIPRPAASAAGLAAGALSNFVLHRAWTFEGGAAQPVARQILGYATGLALIYAVRLLVFAGLGLAQVPIQDGPAVFLAAGVSFVVNFLFLRKLVFNRGSRS